MGVGPLVIAHRGASGTRPEHTREAFLTALDLGADVLEVDVVSTSDRVLVARHDWALSRTTDVASRASLAGRRRTRSGRQGPVTDWWVDQMSWDEVSVLRARERWPEIRPASAALDGLLKLRTLRETLDLAHSEAGRRGREVGVAVELKDVAAAAAQHGMDLVDLLLDDLAAVGVPSSRVPVWVLAFESAPLRRLSRHRLGQRPGLRLVQLVEDRAPDGGAQWDDVAQYADAVGASLDVVLDGAGASAGVEVAAQARRRRLDLWCWTLRAENAFLPPWLRRGADAHAAGRVDVLVAEALERGITGLVTDQPDVVRRAASVGS